MHRGSAGINLTTHLAGATRLCTWVTAIQLPARPPDGLRRIRFTQIRNVSVAVRGLVNRKRPFAVEDNCGSWLTFVGDGAAAL